MLKRACVCLRLLLVSLHAIAPGSLLLVSSIDSCHYLYRLSQLDGPPVVTFAGHRAGSFCVKSGFSPCGGYLVSGSSDGKAYVWQVRGLHMLPLLTSMTRSQSGFYFDWIHVFLHTSVLAGWLCAALSVGQGSSFGWVRLPLIDGCRAAKLAHPAAVRASFSTPNVITHFVATHAHTLPFGPPPGGSASWACCSCNLR